MRIQLKFGEDKYSTKIMAARASWIDKAQKFSSLTFYGDFIIDGKLVNEYTLKFRSDIAFSLCKKLEKEGTADLTTDYVTGYILK